MMRSKPYLISKNNRDFLSQSIFELIQYYTAPYPISNQRVYPPVFLYKLGTVSNKGAHNVTT